jgi:hypothetical protein
MRSSTLARGLDSRGGGATNTHDFVALFARGAAERAGFRSSDIGAVERNTGEGE